MRKNIESVVFDFDGTLAELRLDFAEMKRRLSLLAEEYLVPGPPPAFLPVLEWLDWLEEKIGEANGGVRNGFRPQALALIVDMEMEAARKGSLFPFSRPLLKELCDARIKTAIITRNCEAAVRRVFPDISDHCLAFLARDHVASPKPHPSHIQLALEAICGEAQTALMIGDHPLDIRTGKAAGVRTAGVCSGNTPRETLLEAGADWVAGDCRELVDLLCEEGVLKL